MNVLKDFSFFKNASTTIESNVLTNTNGSILQLQISGDGTSFSVKVKGRVDVENDDYVTLSLIKESDLSKTSTITSNNIYMCDVSGIQNIKLEITAISSGAINAFGRLLSD